jgi:hypothetical protein
LADFLFVYVVDEWCRETNYIVVVKVFDPEERWSAQEIVDHRYFDGVRDLQAPPEWTWVNDEHHTSDKRRSLPEQSINYEAMRLGFTDHDN